MDVVQITQVIRIQAYFRMHQCRMLYVSTLQRLRKRERERKKEIKDIECESDILSRKVRVDRHEFIKNSKHIIYSNFPGVTLQGERVYGKGLTQTITYKALNDSVGRTCAISYKQHSKNSIYFVLSFHDKQVIMKCFKCQGFVVLHEKDNLLTRLKDDIVVSEKVATKKAKKNNILPSISYSDIVQFEHNYIDVDNSTVLEFYEELQFSYVPARLDKKAPVFSSWTTSTVKDNHTINFEFNNVAIVTGLNSNCFCVDVDVADNGLRFFQSLCHQNNYRYDLHTLTVETPSQGLHLYFLYNSKFPENSVRMNDSDGNRIGIDIRSTGGCCIGPPSKYEKGSYKFLCMKKPQECPSFLLEALS